jgi:ABC-type lipoprotein release transport system permease subunit
LSPTLAVTVRSGDVFQAALVAGAVTVAAGLVPLVRAVHVDPASVFRRAS